MTTAAAKKISHSRLLEVVSYDHVTGDFRWRVAVSRKTRVGVKVGTRVQMQRGGVYLRGKIDHQLYTLHRLAWFYVHGEWPAGEIDHINGDTCDNRISNLRVVSRAVNQENIRGAKRNSVTGYLGVMFTREGRYRAAIRSRGVYHHLGHFDAPEDAHEAYVQAKRRLHEGCTL